MTIDATVGRERRYEDPHLRETWERIRSEVRAIQARGGVVDIPGETAGDSGAVD